MSWSEVKTAYARLAEAARSEFEDAAQAPETAAAWKSFKAVAHRGPSEIPYHMRAHFKYLAEISQQRDRSDIRILDHGCGGGLTLLYLLANGYDGIFGIDIGGHPDVWNTFLRDHAAISGPRFHVYDGIKLPFDDASFDFIFSEEVLEHVRPDVIGRYYSEEERVLRPGGIVFHRVPHRLTPYEGHTRTWFLHYLPRGLWLRSLRLLDKDTTTAETAIFLRWPWSHRRLVRENLGSCEDRTLDRFAGLTDFSDFDGPRGIRRFVGRILAVPLLGQMAGVVIRNLVMLDTVSRAGSGESERRLR